jgi:peptidoglycan-associated lipoprotein
MQKRVSFYAVVLFSGVVFMTAGCAKQEVLNKDDGIAPKPVAKQTDSQVTSAKQASSDKHSDTASNPQSQKVSAIAQLQAALDKIYFDYDSAALSETARNTLTKNASVLMKEATAKIRIEGNCDERGSAEYNLALGDSRAKAAERYLIALGVKPDRMSAISYGNEKPSVQGSNEAAWAKNRRDEFVVVSR